jgi:two-component system response regulator QseB
MQDVLLTKSERTVIALLERSGTATHEAIHDALYPDGEWCESNVVQVLIHQLRAKLGRDRIKSVRGVGYQLAPKTT